MTRIFQVCDAPRFPMASYLALATTTATASLSANLEKLGEGGSSGSGPRARARLACCRERRLLVTFHLVRPASGAG